jgi:uncharacterized membrane protein (UPF0127 family)
MKKIALSLALVALLSGCAEDASTTAISILGGSGDSTGDTVVEVLGEQGLEEAGYALYDLSLTTQTGTHELQVAVADERSERVAGLQVVDHLNSNQGMWFEWRDEAPREFWMKDMVIDLDILFVNGAGEIVTIYDGVPPCSAYDATQNNCEIYSSIESVPFVLELPKGSVERYDISLNDVVEPPANVVSQTVIE